MRDGLAAEGDLIIVTKGEFSGVSGGTNSMKILKVQRQPQMSRPVRILAWILGTLAALAVVAVAAAWLDAAREPPARRGRGAACRASAPRSRSSAMPPACR